MIANLKAFEIHLGKESISPLSSFKVSLAAHSEDLARHFILFFERIKSSQNDNPKVSIG